MDDLYKLLSPAHAYVVVSMYISQQASHWRRDAFRDMLTTWGMRYELQVFNIYKRYILLV